MLGLDLTTDPDVVMRPEIAVKVLVRGMQEGWFTGVILDKYDTFEDMRRIVNGTDKAALIAGYAREYLAEMPKRGINWGAILRFIMGIFKR